MRKRTTDRRKFGKAGQFPLVDRDGNIIPRDRSKQADRRLRNIGVVELRVAASGRE